MRAVQKFYCRSVRGFHLQIPWLFLFSVADGNEGPGRKAEPNGGLPAKEYIYDAHARACRDVYGVAETTTAGCIRRVATGGGQARRNCFGGETREELRATLLQIRKPR